MSRRSQLITMREAVETQAAHLWRDYESEAAAVDRLIDSQKAEYQGRVDEGKLRDHEGSGPTGPPVSRNGQ